MDIDLAALRALERDRDISMSVLIPAIEQALLVELKAVKALDQAHHAQCINYLKASGLRLGLLLNFGTPRLEIKRIANGQ